MCQTTEAPGTWDLQVIPETSTDLTTWNPDAILVEQHVNGDGSITKVYRSPVPFASDVRRQMRVRVVKP